MKRTPDTAAALAKQFFDECFQAFVYAKKRIAQAANDMGSQLRELNDKRLRAMRAIAENAIPDLTHETLVNLATADLREFGSRTKVQHALNEAIEARLSWGDWLWSLWIHPTKSFYAYYDLRDGTLEMLREQLVDFLEMKIGVLERLAPVRGIEAELAALNARYESLLKTESHVERRYETLVALEHLVHEGLWDDFLLSSMQNACVALRERSARPQRVFDEHDPVLGWIMWLPETLKGWEVDQLPVAV